ncbi:trypsin-like peptidase domain-containing protein [Promicromonospora sp. NPDC057488]|uniref:trypsin-like peptidase domain-containing protein n=1 Tax=Promicromonospora sp. NPDC057488 TaxID=3346147 RepID=UPI00366C0200
MTDQNSTTPQPEQQPSGTQPTEQLPVAGSAPVPNAGGEQSATPAQSTAPVPAPAPVPSPAPAPAPGVTPAQAARAQHTPQDAAAQHQPAQHQAPQHEAPQHQAPQPEAAQHQTAQLPAAQHQAQPQHQPQHPAQAQHQAQPQPQVHAQQHHTTPLQTVTPGAGPGPSPAYVNPYSAPATVAAEPRTRNRTWVPVVAAAAAAAVLASAGTAGLLTLTGGADNGASLADVGQSNNQTVPVKSSTVENPDWTAVTSAVQQSVVSIQVESQAGGAEGSGVVLDSQGRVLTNNHVVSGAQTVQVTLSDGSVYDAKIVGTDPTTDLAVVQLSDPPSDLKPAKFADSDNVVVGEPVMALGNPLGLANTATTGIVSALDRPVTASAEDGTDQVVTNAIQIDAAVNPGNSGGPLFNASGEVIGITSSIATLSSGGGGTSSSSGSIGLGFAIPGNLASQIGDQLKENGTAQHAFLGVSMSDATATADGVTRRGAGVEDVVADSPAGNAGIKQGDVIVAIDGSAVNSPESLTAFVREKEAGDKSVLTVVRDGKTQEITVTLAVKDEADTSSQDQQQGQQGQLPGQDQGQQDGSGSGSDQTNPNNIPDWLQQFFDNQG